MVQILNLLVWSGLGLLFILSFMFWPKSHSLYIMSILSFFLEPVPTILGIGLLLIFWLAKRQRQTQKNWYLAKLIASQQHIFLTHVEAAKTPWEAINLAWESEPLLQHWLQSIKQLLVQQIPLTTSLRSVSHVAPRPIAHTFLLITASLEEGLNMQATGLLFERRINQVILREQLAKNQRLPFWLLTYSFLVIEGLILLQLFFTNHLHLFLNTTVGWSLLTYVGTSSLLAFAVPYIYLGQHYTPLL